MKTMKASFRKMMLTTHITFSIGWFGAVAVFLALAITGLSTQNSQTARAACIALKLSTWLVVVPFCIASLITGIIQGLGTKWGLFKHYWIIVKLVLTLAMTILLWLHLEPINYLASVANQTSFSNTEQTNSFIQLISKAGAALLVLIAIITISKYKPWGKVGVTKFKTSALTNVNWKRILMVVGICLFIGMIVIHLFGGGVKH